MDALPLEPGANKTDNRLVAGGQMDALGWPQALFDHAPLGIYLVDTNFCIRAINPTALPFFGEISALIGRDFAEVVHILWEQEYADEIVRLFRHTLETGTPYRTP